MTTGSTKRRVNALEAKSRPAKRMVLVVGKAGAQCEADEEALDRYIREHGPDSVREDDCLWIVTCENSKWRQSEGVAACGTH